jgi:hypothetical protein
LLLLYLKDSGKDHLIDLYYILHSFNALICQLTNVSQSTMMLMMTMVSSNEKVNKGAVGFDSSHTTSDDNALIQGFGVLKVMRTIFVECQFVLPCVLVIVIAKSVAIIFPIQMAVAVLCRTTVSSVWPVVVVA